MSKRVPSRLPPGHFEQLLRSGELHRVARQCESQADLARAIGMTPDAIVCARIRLKRRGVHVPTFEELRAEPGVLTDAQSRRAETALASERWPSVAAFDAVPDRDDQRQAAADHTDRDFEDEEKTIPNMGIAVPDEGTPPLPTIPSGHRVHKVSTLIDAATGEQKLQWIKTSAQNDERQGWLDAIRSMSAELPRVESIAPPVRSNDDLLVVLPVGDPHVGLHAWRKDAGENFNLDIAKRNLIAAFQHLIALAPDAAEALLIFIGDNSHIDSQNNTTTSGTRQDADSRTIKIADTLIEIERHAVRLALEKFGRARIIIERGNHDDLLSAMNALALSLLYENEPRVSVDTSPEHYHWHRFGSNLIGTHHGDKAKPMDLLGVMAVDRADDWSETRHRRFYCGHLHHQIVKEVPGMIVEYLPTLAGSDAWHRSMGYRSQRAMYMDVFHREHGHINRHIVGIRQLCEVAA